MVWLLVVIFLLVAFAFAFIRDVENVVTSVKLRIRIVSIPSLRSV